MGISKASKTTAHMWQFYRKYIGLRETELKTLVFDSTYINDDLGRTVLMIKCKIHFKSPSKYFASIMFFNFPVKTNSSLMYKREYLMQ